MQEFEPITKDNIVEVLKKSKFEVFEHSVWDGGDFLKNGFAYIDFLEMDYFINIKGNALATDDFDEFIAFIEEKGV